MCYIMPADSFVWRLKLTKGQTDSCSIVSIHSSQSFDKYIGENRNLRQENDIESSILPSPGLYSSYTLDILYSWPIEG